jgi:hypothetical protein
VLSGRSRASEICWRDKIGFSSEKRKRRSIPRSRDCSVFVATRYSHIARVSYYIV